MPRPKAELTCGNCRYAMDRHVDAKAAAAADQAGHPLPQLHCRRYPVPQTKRPEDWCGEHKPGEG